MIRILLDQGLPRSAAFLLREEGWDVLHTGDIGLHQATDSQLLEFAHLIKEIWPKIEAQIIKGAVVSVTESGIRLRNIPVLSS